ncbi:MAG: TetR family transcriptional regulator [Mycobacteriaceae bacterium]|uniref:TetR family transcriptional regulator n=1 Tax=Corynebacterium sp. TaxID=1720 RepID=UPI003F945B37
MTDVTDSAPNEAASDDQVSRRRADETRSRILTCARTAFNQRPYSEVSLKDIAVDVGVSAPLIIKYFGSKEHLYEAQLDFSPAAARIAEVEYSSLGAYMARIVVESPDDSPNSLIRKLADAGGNRHIVDTLGKVFREQMVAPVMKRVVDEAGDASAAATSHAEMRAEAAISMASGVALMRRLVTQEYFRCTDLEAFIAYYGGLIQNVLDGEGIGR